MTNQKIIQEQIAWIESGKIGCVFASALVKHADLIGWQFVVTPMKLTIPKNCLIYSAIFPYNNIDGVKRWAINNGMYIERLSNLYDGLRMKGKDGISWVQYFGPDSHVKTRQAPYPMLSFTVKLPAKYYAKVGWNGILHLAHASIKYITDKKADTLWDQSIVKTKKELGHSPTLREAAKTTYLR